MKYQAVLFDFDGTLLDSEAMVRHCYSYLFQKYSTIEAFTHERQLEVFGPPLRVEMEKFFPDLDPDALVEEYRIFQEKLPGQGVVHLFPHALDVLKTLKEEGNVLAVVSSRLTNSCKLWMNEFDMEQYFDVIFGQEKYEKHKPHPEGILKACQLLQVDPAKCIYIGDNASDVIAANKAGCDSVAFVSNHEKRSDIETSSPNHVIEDLRELLEICR